MIAPGDVLLGRYRITRYIGSGASANVYVAVDLQLDREVATKVLRPEVAVRPGFLERFAREGRVLARLQHGNAVTVHDFGEHDGQPVLIMELLSGPTLHDLIAETAAAFAPARVLALGGGLADVLTAAHAIGLIHRDIKPGNIIVEPVAGGAERPVLLDFGLAFLVDDGPLGRHSASGALTGTPHYMSPEQARGVDVGRPSDVYSLGCVLYEMACGLPPFDAESQVEVLTQHLYVAAPPVRGRLAALDAPLALDQLLAEMLAKSAAMRPTASEVRQRLLEMAAGEERRGQVVDLGREARMVAAPAVAAVEAAGPLEVTVAFDGPAPSHGFVTALAANGIKVVGDAAATFSALLAPDASPERVRALGARGAPVIAAAHRGDLDRILALLKAGASEVAELPLEPADVSAKIARTVRRAARRGAS
jgi:serine/threonine-protein kinase